MGFFFDRKLKLKELEMRMKAKTELRLVTARMVTPLKIQACERFLLFLERSQLPVLVKRIYSPGMLKDGFHIALLQSIEEEFEHNLAQQLYVSNDAWTAVKSAKEELVNQINATFDKTDGGTDVALIAQALVALPNPFIDQAIIMLKKEFNEI
ncbi:MAG: hypothetical protein J6W30_06315 [Bacteroidales bacterium]|nr:hypothetical protein [Bacteroidales bacterium]